MGVTNIVGEITQNCLMTRTRRISRFVTNLSDHELRHYGVNAPQFSLLVLIAKVGNASRAEIGRAKLPRSLNADTQSRPPPE